MILQILISTMHQKDASLLDRMQVPCEAVVINQCSQESSRIISRPSGDVLWIDTTERGLSNSRNMALRNAQGEICLLADDDEIFDERTIPTITTAFQQYPKMDIASFQLEDIEFQQKKYKKNPRRRKWLGVNQSTSGEIAFRRGALCSKSILFNPQFGSGAKYQMSEENILLWRCVAQGLWLQYIPLPIAKRHVDKSTWFTGYNQGYFFNKGACFAAMSKVWFPLLNAQYAFRKRRLNEEKLGFLKLFRMMMKGSQDWRKNNPATRRLTKASL